MIIFKDILTGDEMLSDSFCMCDHPSYEGFLLQVQGKVTSENTGIDESKIGGNQSVEEQCEQVEDGSIQACNIIRAHQLQEAFFVDKKDFQLQMSNYLKAIVKRFESCGCEDKPATQKQKDTWNKDKFMAFGKTFVKDAWPKIKSGDWKIYMGSTDTGDAPHCLCFMDYPDKDLDGHDQDGFHPVMMFIKHGFYEEKF